MKYAYLMTAMKYISFVVVAMGSIFLYGNGLESVSTNEEFDFKTWSASVSNISDSWKDKPSEYSLVIKREVDLVVKMDNHHEKIKRIRFLITNVVDKVSIADSASLVRQQSDLLLYCLNAKECVADVDSWKNIARAIGDFRGRIVPNYRKKSVLNPGAPGMTEAEIKKLRDLNDVNVELDRLQRDLSESSCMWTAMLISMMKTNSKQFSRDAFTRIVCEVVVLAHFSDDEKRELLQIADVEFVRPTLLRCSAR